MLHQILILRDNLKVTVEEKLGYFPGSKIATSVAEFQISTG